MTRPVDGPSINSIEYWTERHLGNWEEAGGSEQTRFFAELAMDHAPPWLSTLIRANQMSVCDVGCALGEAVATLASHLPECHVTGMEVAKSAVQKAREKHPDLIFVEGDLRSLKEPVDALFLSNILEHFRDPWALLAKTVPFVQKLYWILVPFDDHSGIVEHVYRFTEDRIHTRVGADFVLCFAKVVDARNLEGTQWPGEQLMLVYAKSDLLPEICELAATVAWKEANTAFLEPTTDAFVERLATISLREFGLARQLNRVTSGVLEHLRTSGSVAPDCETAHGVAERVSNDGGLHAAMNRLQAGVNQLVSTREVLLSHRCAFREHVDELNEKLTTLSEHLEPVGHMSFVLQTLSQIKRIGEGELLRVAEERDEARAKYEELAERYRNLHKNLDDVTGQLQERQAESIRLEKTLRSEIELMKSTQRDERLHLEGAIETLKSRYRNDRLHLEAEINRARAVVRSYQSSRSWIITRPVRAVSRALKKLLKRPASIFHDAEFLPVLPPALDSNPEKHVSPDSMPAVVLPSARHQFLDLIGERAQTAPLVFAQAMIIPWRVPLFQRPQHMARAIAREGGVSLYMSFKDEWAGTYQELEDNLFIVRDSDLLTELRGSTVSFYSTSPGPTPEMYRQTVENGNILLYEYIDHISAEISGQQHVKRLRELFSEAVAHADLIACSARVLLDEMVARRGDKGGVFYLPNAVDYDHFFRAHVDEKRTIPRKLQKIVESGRPMVGYFGAVAPWIWYEALDDLARLNADINFVLIGPDYYGGSKKIPSLPNLHWLGVVDYHDLPLWAQHFDVAMIPFRPGEIARTTSPLKLFEYFALGKPVVATAEMTECVAFDEVFSGNNVDELNAALTSALACRHEDAYVRRLTDIARQNSWSARARTLISEVNAHAGEW